MDAAGEEVLQQLHFGKRVHPVGVEIRQIFQLDPESGGVIGGGLVHMLVHPPGRARHLAVESAAGRAAGNIGVRDAAVERFKVSGGFQCQELLCLVLRLRHGQALQIEQDVAVRIADLKL